METKKHLKVILSMSGLLAMVSVGQAITINVDGVNHATLSSAIAAAHAADDGPDVINLTTNTLSTADPVQILLDKPLTINGDAENGGVGDGVPCDILVDTPAIVAAADAGLPFKSYIEARAVGDVTVNNIRFRPSSNGNFAGSTNEIASNVSGIRIHLPANAAETGNYTFMKVAVAGSKGAANTYVALDDGADIFNNSSKKWGGLNGSTDANVAKHAALHVSSESAGAGNVNLLLDHCHIGMSRGCALSVNGPVGEPSRVNLEIKGGVFGHCARDAIRIANATAKIQGTQNDRVRVLRAATLDGANSHSIEIIDSQVSLIEYVDSAGCNTANGFSIRGITTLVSEIAHCRGMGRFAQPAINITNEQLYVTAGAMITSIHDSTFHGLGTNPDPVHINNGIVNFKDTIFTSDLNGDVQVSTTSLDVVSLTNCALPTDGLTSETLANPPVQGAGSANVAIVAPVAVSPVYLLTLADYDWSDAQGANDPNNGIGNRNVLRPSNTAYNGASSTAGVLYGGAGPAPNAGIASDVWMLM